MDQSTLKALNDKVYEKRKNAALDLERVVREASAVNDTKKLEAIIEQLCVLTGSTNSNSRSGSIMGLAGVAIALGPKIADHLAAIVPPVFACFNDPDSRVRYFACESMYNIAKVAKGEILIFFNELFDAMSKLAADTELPVKNGAELLDRLIKDIVTEQASTYVSVTVQSRPPSPGPMSVTQRDEKKAQAQPERAFSLARFIPLLRERIYVLNPFTRTYLVSWLTVLDSVPELELVSYLPEFLDGLLKFLGDPTVDIRTATQNVLADFLREIRDIAELQKIQEEEQQRRLEERTQKIALEATTTSSPIHSRRESNVPANEKQPSGKKAGVDEDLDENALEEDEMDEGQVDDDADDAAFDDNDDDGDDSAEWVPGQGVIVDHAAIVEILIEHLSFPDEEIQATCLRWIAEFLLFVQPVMVPFAPRLIPVILSSLAHHVGSIRTAANDTNDNLFAVIQAIPVPSTPPPTPGPHLSPQHQHLAAPGKASDSASGAAGRGRSLPSTSPPLPSVPFSGSGRMPSSERTMAYKSQPVDSVVSSTLVSHGDTDTRSRSSTSDTGTGLGDSDPFDYGATVNALTLQFLNEHEETRVAALEWITMLHQKAPRKILAIDDPSAEATRGNVRSKTQAHTGSGLSIALLLKMLSDPSEKVLRQDLQLLAQISSRADDEYFPDFMMSLLSLFSTDRRLLESRGSLIIRQLCSSLNTERIYRTFAEILEKDEDLEFASIMVQNLNLIMITSPELSEFRKRLKNLESRDGQALFTVLYKTWSHNAVATFSLCLLAQAYEQACALLQIFAELEITVGLLIQIDKLVQLLESPVFTSLRLQLLEPERYPYLLKAMYGLLMLLPQSSAFATLRNRLSAVSSLGFLQTVPRSSYGTTSSRIASTSGSGVGGGGSSSNNPQQQPASHHIRWTELVSHFRQTQKRRSLAAAQIGGEAALEGIVSGGLVGQGVGPQQQRDQVSSAAASVVGGSRNVSGVGIGGGGGGGGGAGGRKKFGTVQRTDSGTTIKASSAAGLGLAWRGGSTEQDSAVGSRSSSTRPTSPGGTGTGRRRPVASIAGSLSSHVRRT
ncbi:hypothetical protein ACM66B_002598 [Microbotryomycetes sp. NB124-2]